MEPINEAERNRQVELENYFLKMQLSERDERIAALEAKLAQTLSAKKHEIANWRRIVRDLSDAEEQCRNLLKTYDYSNADGVEPLVDVIQRAIAHIWRKRWMSNR